MRPEHSLLLIGYSLIVVFKIWWIPRRVWRLPLRNGEGYFMDVAVPDGWHASEQGRLWWRRYWVTIMLPLVLEAMGFAAIVMWGQWRQIPLLALYAPAYVALSTGFLNWWRRSSGANQHRPTRVAITLEERRLSQYFNWPTEATMMVLLAATWTALAVWGDAHTGWRLPITITYLIAGFTAIKASVVRRGWALPVEHAREYQQWLEGRKRQAVHVFDNVRWFLTVILIGYAAMRTFEVVAAILPVGWFRIVTSILLWVLIMIRLAWSTSLQPAAPDSPLSAMSIGSIKGWPSVGMFMAGLAALLFWPAG
jgi:hypothetical protein